MTTVYFALQRGPRYELVVGKIKKAFESFGQVKRAFLYDRSKCGIDGYIGNVLYVRFLAMRSNPSQAYCRLQKLCLILQM